jgi:WD40 repeat protein
MEEAKPSFKLKDIEPETWRMTNTKDHLFFSDADGTVIGYLINKREVGVKFSAGEAVTSLQYNPTKKLLAAGTLKGTVVIWDVTSGREVERFLAMPQEEGKAAGKRRL